MLIYRPAYDPYHAIVRLAKIVRFQTVTEFEIEKLLILDFYFLFPVLLQQVRLPKALVSIRSKVTKSANKYMFSGKPFLVFRSMSPHQKAALMVLVKRGSIDPTAFDRGFVRAGVNWDGLDAVSRATDKEQKTLTILVNEIATIPLLGADGLKARSGLMEFKYDAL